MIINSVLIVFSVLVSFALLFVEDWRYRLSLVAITQLIGFILIVQIWPLPLAAVKLISGWMGVTLLATTLTSRNIFVENPHISSRIFRSLLGVFVWILVLVSVQRFNEWLPISYTNLFVGLVFFVSGIIYLAIRSTTLDTILGLLLFFEGFDVIYSSLEGSALVTGLFGVIIISVCLTGSFLEGGFKFRGAE